MNCKKGFSLTELTAVMTIIALLASTATALTYLKRNAMLVAVMDEIGKLNQAYITFKSIYNEIPGDMFDATAKFGASQNGITTQNGNGNNIINMTTNEQVAAFQHLALAGLITGNYTGTWSGVSSSALMYIPGVVPLSGYYFSSTSNSSFSGATWYVFAPSTNSTNDSTITYAGIHDDNGNGNIDWNIAEPVHPVITPFDMAKLDNKYDDGWPNTGKIIAGNGIDLDDSTVLSCFTGTTPSGVYNTSAGSVFGGGTPFCFFSVIIEHKLQ